MTEKYLTRKEIETNWIFDTIFTTDLFLHGYLYTNLLELISDLSICEQISENTIYYSQYNTLYYQNNTLLYGVSHINPTKYVFYNINDIAYEDFIRGAIKQTFKNKTEITQSNWFVLMEYLFHEQFHELVLSYLKKLNLIKNKNDTLSKVIQTLNYISKNTDEKYYKKNYIFDILQYLEIPIKNSTFLANAVSSSKNYDDLIVFLKNYENSI